MSEENNIELRSEEFQDVLGDTPPWILRWGITLSAIVVILFLIGSFIFKYPDTISAEMTLTSLTPPASIIAKTTGKLKELKVIDNEQIHSGDYLAVIENTAQTKDVLQLKEYLKTVIHTDTMLLPPKNLNLGNIQALYSSFYIVFTEYDDFMRLQYYLTKKEILQNRIVKYNAHCNSLVRQKSIIEKQLKIMKNQYERDSTLYHRGVIAYEALESTKNQYLQSCLSLENMNSTIENTKIELMQMEEGILDIENQYIERKNTLESQIKTYLNQLTAEIQSWELTYAFISPIDGKITFTNIWAQNQNILAGQNVFNIIPKTVDKLMGKALLPMSRSGKVKIGQKVNIRFDNFPDNEFGIVRGFVKNISLVPTKEDTGFYYVVDIDLSLGLTTTYNKKLPYLPEMKAIADIITDDLSLFERLIMPLKKIHTVWE
jgi:HlyD family secretion protein